MPDPNGAEPKKADYLELKAVGLNKTAIICYESLFRKGGTSVEQLAKRLRRPRTGLYRVLKQLERKGFVTGLKTESQPIYFFAEPVEEALRRYADYQRLVLGDLIREQKKARAGRTGNY